MMFYMCKNITHMPPLPMIQTKKFKIMLLIFHIFNPVIFQILKLRSAESCPDVLQVYNFCSSPRRLLLFSCAATKYKIPFWWCAKVSVCVSATHPESSWEPTLHHIWLTDWFLQTLLLLGNTFLAFILSYILFYKTSYYFKSHNSPSLAIFARDLA
jgi:hypothetical protein